MNERAQKIGNDSTAPVVDMLMVTYLHVEVYDVVGMNEFNALADLSHDAYARFLGQNKIFAYDAIEQFATVDTA